MAERSKSIRPPSIDLPQSSALFLALFPLSTASLHAYPSNHTLPFSILNHKLFSLSLPCPSSLNLLASSSQQCTLSLTVQPVLKLHPPLQNKSHTHHTNTRFDDGQYSATPVKKYLPRILQPTPTDLVIKRRVEEPVAIVVEFGNIDGAGASRREGELAAAWFRQPYLVRGEFWVELFPD